CELKGGIYVDGHNSRHPLLLHGNPDQLLGHLHSNFIVRNEQKLRLFRHAANQVGITLSIGIVQRGVDFVKQTKRGRIKLEERELQSRRGKRLLAARKQVDGAVSFSGRLRHNWHARVQNFVAGHYELRLAAAKETRKQLAK